MAITLAGIVYDDTGTALSGAQVVARNSSGTPTTIIASTLADGIWSTTSLADETYTIEVTYQGKVRKWNGTSSSIQVNRLTVGANKVVLDVAGLIFINDTSNANMTQGLTLNQGSSDNEIISLKSSDIAHGMTDVTETDTYGFVYKHSPGSGGMVVEGLSESSSGLVLHGTGTSEETAKTTGTSGAIILQSRLKSGTTRGLLSADANLVVIKNHNTVRFIFDADGDSHQDVGTAWTNFDAYDDIALLDALSVEVSKPDDPIKAMLAEYINTHKDVLEKNRIVTFNEDGHHFINWSRANMLVIGAIRQLGREVTHLKEQLSLPNPNIAYLV